MKTKGTKRSGLFLQRSRSLGSLTDEIELKHISWTPISFSPQRFSTGNNNLVYIGPRCVCVLSHSLFLHHKKNVCLLVSSDKIRYLWKRPLFRVFCRLLQHCMLYRKEPEEGRAQFTVFVPVNVQVNMWPMPHVRDAFTNLRVPFP